MSEDEEAPAADEGEGSKDGEKKDEPESEADQRTKRFEIAFGLTLSVFAAVLAVNELASGKYGDDELKLASEKTGNYLWYQSKGIKESLAEGQRDLLKSLAEANVIPPEKNEGVKKHLGELEGRIVRYGKEKREILDGSAGVGEAGWVLETGGELGKVVGVKDQDRELEKLGRAGDRFDVATLFLQLCLVAGAIGLLMSRPGTKRVFLGAMIVLGSLGAVAFTYAIRTVL